MNNSCFDVYECLTVRSSDESDRSQMNRFLEEMPGFGEEERGVESSPIHFGTTFHPKVSTGKGFYEHRMFDDESSSSTLKKCDHHVDKLRPMSWGKISSQIDNLNKIKEEIRKSNAMVLELVDGAIQQLHKEKPRREQKQCDAYCPGKCIINLSALPYY
ncbi:unnamed protein product [Mytilus edulis]|uniref:Uncharacterized protein n=1 Tax=Mytilus edulis TaxID=6550 RepID=A0A8S3UM13_MYTED|nr:unnamed protein product [Mytilus edulis]